MNSRGTFREFRRDYLTTHGLQQRRHGRHCPKLILEIDFTVFRECGIAVAAAIFLTFTRAHVGFSTFTSFVYLFEHERSAFGRRSRLFLGVRPPCFFESIALQVAHIHFHSFKICNVLPIGRKSLDDFIEMVDRIVQLGLGRIALRLVVHLIQHAEPTLLQHASILQRVHHSHERVVVQRPLLPFLTQPRRLVLRLRV